MMWSGAVSLHAWNNAHASRIRFAGKNGPAHGQLTVERVEVELELRHDTKVGTGAAHRPKEIGVLVLAGGDVTAIRGDDVD
jgi:hypothetical protein